MIRTGAMAAAAWVALLGGWAFPGGARALPVGTDPPPVAADAMPTEGGPQAVAVLGVAFPDPAAGDPFVPILVEVAAAALLAAPPAGIAEGEIRVRALDGAGTLLDSFRQPFSLAPRETDDPLAETGLKLFGVLRLPPGQQRLEVEVLDAGGESIGTAAVPLLVPRFGAGEATLSVPLFPEPFDHWRVFRQSESPHQLAFPFRAVGGDAFMPSATPVLSLEGAASFYLVGHDLGEVVEGLEARLLDDRGVAIPVTARVEAHDDGELLGQTRLLVSLEADRPAPGSYRLEISMPGVVGEVGVDVRFAQHARPHEATGPQPPRPESDPMAEVEALAGDLTPEEVTRRYREALALSVAGSIERATTALQRVEAEATTGRRPGEMRALRRLQLGVIEELLARGSSPLPILHLHALAGIEYLDWNHPWLLVHTRSLLVDLVSWWVSAEGSDRAARPSDNARLGALVLAAAGASRAALEVDPTNTLALLQLAQEEERRGRLAEAIGLLTRFRKELPEDPHGRLRLGMILNRLGQGEEAAELLAAVLSGEAPGWIASLAYQELARIERQASRDARAEALLRRGIEEVGDQTLYLQLAFYLDRWQRSAEAVTLLSRMPLAAAGGEVAPRFRYSSAAEAERIAARQRLAAEAQRRVPSLRAALESGSPNGEGSP